MHLPPHPFERSSDRRSRPRAIAVAAAAALAGFAVSCASPGPPRPPSLHLPAVVTDLSAERVGDRVSLRWTTPERTTDRLPVPAPLTAEICRETGAPKKPAAAGKTPECTAVVRVPVKPGPSEASAPLSAPLTADPVTALRYRVRILNPQNRSAGDSKAVIVPSGAAPVTVAGLHAASIREGAVVEWSAVSSPAIIELKRSLVSALKPNASAPKPKPNAPATKPNAPAAKPDAKPKKSSGMALPSDEEPAEVRLMSADPKTHPDAADPGGTLDRTARRGESYAYSAQRLRTVTVAGETFELRSEFSSPVTLRITDTFPPAAPGGLESVPSTSNGKAAIDLSWQPGADIDLAGYNVYRKSGTGQFTRLNTAPVIGPAYTDTTVAPATSYIYRVTAVDSTGNESAPSAEVTETAEAPNP